ncbi:helix-turn-helix domain-containing protein [Trebonia kvetii]|uniref:Helix-turn-helix domain-containing protein n=1 Tax=Trebonia kvetii TaxID=2480626 RepID=A0A6P2C407_9ACTN|nr:helix-turn-helix domain-containing protein [Trebonia kvetii]TVZ06124.1 helix-turn-helix domain-containing protein [Trebonia kvetii]
MSIGDTLAEARRQAGLTITQVSEQTRIRESIIRSIEQGDYSTCGGDFYARGHIRSIAEAVGVDPAPLIREFDAEHGPPGNMRASQIFQPVTPIKIREPRRLHLGRVLAVAVLAAAGYGAYHVISTRDTHSAASPNATTTVRPVVTVTAQPTHTATPKAKPAFPKNEAVIKLTAVSDCWVSLTNTTTGKQIYQGVVKTGQSVTWIEKKQVSIRLGNPPGIHLTVNGKAQQTNSTVPITLSINPLNNASVTVG